MDDAPTTRESPAPTEPRKEAYTMALYVAICLLAAIVAVPKAPTVTSDVLRLVWGITVGLAVAHWFAFRLAARLAAAGAVRRDDVRTAGAQIGGAATVAVLVSLPALVLSPGTALKVAEALLAAFIGLVGYAVARRSGARRARAALFAGVVVVVAAAIAVVKNRLAGH